jgi:hypothetical protein
MNITSLRKAVLGCAAFTALSLIGADQASAINIDFQIGPQGPPPPRVEHPWGRPYPGAVWIPGYYQWTHGRYVWVAGYYTYPPRPGSHWVGPAYVVRGGVYYYHPGHWAY